MANPKDRAVSVSILDGRLLVMRRHRDGDDYCVLPGGGVESGEDPEDAVLRELEEETGLTGVVDKRLWTLEHRDRVAHYFLVSVKPGPMVVGGPEAVKASPTNSYSPGWISLRELDEENLQPTELRDLVCGLSKQGVPADERLR